MNPITLWPVLGRAIEIAKLGDFSISIHYSEDYRGGSDDYQWLKNELKGFFEDFVHNGDIKIVIDKPEQNQITNKYALVDIERNLIAARKNIRPAVECDEMTKGLYKKADRIFEFSILEKQKIMDVSAVIAQLENSPKIKIEHAAEAIHYNTIVLDEYIFAEPKKLAFSETQSRNGRYGLIDTNEKFIIIEQLKSVIQKHTEKLDTMKENFSKWDEEGWDDAQFDSCEQQIQVLASVLADLKKLIKKQ